MKEIQLTQGKVALVDDEDYEWLNQWKWTYNQAGKTMRAVRHTHNGHHYKGCVFMHRLILDAPAELDVDHIDGNGLNNQRANIRICTRSQNFMNRMKQPGGTSMYKGVRWLKKSGKWEARIKTADEHMSLGRYEDEKDAARAYNEAALKHFGEYARINEIS